MSCSCPSKDWERCCSSQELPEECPVCGDPNADDAGEWLCKEAPGFCCKKHQEEYLAEQRRMDDRAMEEMDREDKLVEEHNAKCPRCAGQSRKYCGHDTNPNNQ